MTAGIDYGLGQTNIDPRTRIRFGVIPAHDVVGWMDDAEADYGKPSCPACGTELDEDSAGGFEFECPCGTKSRDWEWYPEQPIGWWVNDGKVFAWQSGDDTDVIIERSPYYTHAQFCSPCAPGAGHLRNPDPDGPKTYCFGHEWFEGDKAPYPVYSVATGELVEP